MSVTFVKFPIVWCEVGAFVCGIGLCPGPRRLAKLRGRRLLPNVPKKTRLRRRWRQHHPVAWRRGRCPRGCSLVVWRLGALAEAVAIFPAPEARVLKVATSVKAGIFVVLDADYLRRAWHSHKKHFRAFGRVDGE